MSNRGWLRLLPQRLYVFCIFGLGGIAGASLLLGQPEHAALAVVCIAAVLVRPPLGAFAAGLAALLGAWVIAGLALLTALAVGSRAFVARLPRRRRPPDVEALAEAVAAIPSDLVYAARMRAGSAPVTTWHLVAAARAGAPARWDDLLGNNPGPEAWDGPVLDLGQKVGRATEFFAEAAGLAAEIARRTQRRLDPDLLALAATLIPLSAAEQWLNDPEEGIERVLGVPLLDLIEAIAGFADTDAGRDIDRRVQVGGWGRFMALDDRQLIFNLSLAQLPGTVKRLLFS